MTQWWNTTWGKLAPGDEVRDPNCNTWSVHAAITSDCEGEWNITHLELGSLWTTQRMDTPVTARRPDGIPFADQGEAIGLLRDVLGATEVVEES